MTKETSSVLFSIVIPTRNRPELFQQALDSVLGQSFSDIEIQVVVDGSDQASMQAYHALEAQYEDRVHFNYLIHREKGHGQSYSMNHGATQANGEFLCFLDDDDFWTDTNHLQVAAKTIQANPLLDLYYTNQRAYFSDGSEQHENVWIEDLIDKLSLDTSEHIGKPISREELLLSDGFAHLNCSIVRRSYYLGIGGMDENIRYECDRDIFIRCIDGTNSIFHNPAFISQHHIPDKNKKDNMSTLVGLYEKSLYQTVVYQKSMLFSASGTLRQHSSLGLSYIYKRIAEQADENGEKKRAYLYAKQALALNFGFKWFAYTLWLAVKNVGK